MCAFRRIDLRSDPAVVALGVAVRVAMCVPVSVATAILRIRLPVCGIGLVEVVIPLAPRHIGDKLCVQKSALRSVGRANRLQKEKMGASYYLFLHIFTITYLVELVRNRSSRSFTTFGVVGARVVVELAMLVVIFVVEEHMFGLAHRPEVLGSKNILVRFTLVFILPVVDNNKCV